MHKYYQNKRVSNINNPPIMFNNNNANISMKIKAQNKLNLYNKGMFSINSVTHNYYPNKLTNTCIIENNTINPSVKTYSAMRKTRSKKDGTTVSNSINSFECYKDINHELIEHSQNGNEILKHDNGFNKSYTIVIDDLTNNCKKSKKTCQELKSEWKQHFIDNPPCSKDAKIKYCIIAETDFCSSKVMDHSDYLTKLKAKKTCDSSAKYYNSNKQGPCF